MCIIYIRANILGVCKSAHANANLCERKFMQVELHVIVFLLSGDKPLRCRAASKIILLVAEAIGNLVELGFTAL